jgi:lipoprotein NlpI
MAFRWCTLLLWIGAWLCHAAEKPSVDEALASVRRGDPTNALEILTVMTKTSPDEPRPWHLRAQLRSMMGDETGALDDLAEAIRREPKSPYLVQERGMLHFKRNDMEKALIDFDRANELEPRLVPQNWQRGIALYYAGKYAEGRRQFELHQTVNDEDVENAVWHFLCVVRDKNLDEARRNLISIKEDSRIPMKEVHQLFAGKATPADVMKAAESAEATPRERSRHLFYAHLYLGLYFEATGDNAKAAEHIRAAASTAPRDDYMGDVARVHARRLKQ